MKNNWYDKLVNQKAEKWDKYGLSFNEDDYINFITSLLAEQKKEYEKIIEKIHKNHQVELKKAMDACNRNADIIEQLQHRD